MNITPFIESLPATWATSPIYRKGAERADKKISKGKDPIGRAFREQLSPKFTADFLQKHSENFGAIGVFARRSGILILDVDKNLGTLQRAHPDDFNGPHVLSPRENAGKWLFTVPPSMANDLVDLFHEDTKAGYEVLYERQGVIAGAYANGGNYRPVGDFSSLPEAPGWLLEQMLNAKERRDHPGMLSSREQQYMMRSREERYAIVKACLSVIPGQGASSENFWWKIGAMIHSALPDDDGLKLFRDWSQSDEYFADEWASGADPCAEKWGYYRNNKENTAGIGSLITEARKKDPEDTRYKRHGCSSVVEECEATAITVKQVRLSYEEVISRGMEIYEGDQVGRMNYQLHQLALEAGYKDQSGVEKLLLDHMTEDAKGVGHAMTQRSSLKRDYLIPGLLPRPYTVLIYGEAGSGKSATAMALMKHVVDGNSFKLKNQEVPIQPGPVIYFNGDMSEQDFEEEFDLHEIKNQKDFYFEPDFNLYRRMQFVRRMNEIKPAMICIDSLSSCSGSKAGDENKAEFSQPLYWINSSNGSLWPACCVLVLHHAAKSGGARGSSSITAAVAEVWHLARPKENSGLGTDQRVITVGKSRINREGETLIQTQEQDLTVSLAEIDKPSDRQTQAGSVADKIMTRLQINGGWLTRAELAADPLVGGSVAAVKKCLQRLENRGVLEITLQGQKKLYKALSRGEYKGGTNTENPGTDRDLRGDTHPGAKQSVPPAESAIERGDTPTTPKSGVPPLKPSPGAGSQSSEDLSPCSHARNDLAEADSFWDLEGN